MVVVIYVDRDGGRRSVDGQPGNSVMQTALAHDIEGIVAECGGSAMCATCHVYVDPSWAGRLAPMDANEDAMLDSVASERHPNSRLSCQIALDAALDGIVVQIPESQG